MYYIWIVVIVGLVGCSSTSLEQSMSTKTDKVEKVIGGELLFSKDKKQVIKDFEQYGMNTTNIPTYTYGVKVYKIPYTTRDSKNRKIKVSGLLSVPIVDNKKSIGLVSFSHPTIVSDSKSPTVKTKSTKQMTMASVLFTALGGFATIEADYIGYGDSADYAHPYLLKKPSANVTVDFIKAIREFTKKNHININKQLYLIGYSEGGYVSSAALQKLEKLHIPVTAATSIAGAYDLEYIAKRILSNRELSKVNAVNMFLTIRTYAKNYNIDINSIIKEPYASKIDKLLDGKHSRIEFMTALHGVNLENMFKKPFIESFKSDKNHWFRKALVKNSLYDWKPTTPLKLLHCIGDEQVPYEISKNTVNEMKENGSKKVSIITPDLEYIKKFNHGMCFQDAMTHTLNWFGNIRENQ